MVEVPIAAYSLRRVLALLGTVVVAVVVALVWAQVARKLANPQPVSSPVRASSIVWGNRVFSSPGQFTPWLRFRGVAYTVWAGRHPIASAGLEHRPVPAAPTRPAAPRPATTRAEAAPRASRQSPSGGGFPAEAIVVALLAVLAAAALWAASLPSLLRRRYPAFAQRIAPHRDLLFAGAAALLIGIVTSVVLN